MAAEIGIARRLWVRMETVHAVTYFAPESRDAAAALGLRGFWMGYFAFRAAPMGAVSAAAVEATFAGFAPGMVARAVPDAWDQASPGQLLDARRRSSAAALRRLVDEVGPLAEAAGPCLERIVEHAVGRGAVAGRPLFAGNARLPLPDDPVERLWQLCTTLREHRGDGHVGALSRHDLGGCAAHLLLAAERDLDEEVLRPNRGWSELEWGDTADALRARGLLDAAGRLTSEGAALRTTVEAETDALAADPITGALSVDERELLCERLEAAARRIATSGLLPFPNPMGLPPIEDG